MWIVGVGASAAANPWTRGPGGNGRLRRVHVQDAAGPAALHTKGTLFRLSAGGPEMWTIDVVVVDVGGSFGTAQAVNAAETTTVPTTTHHIPGRRTTPQA